MLSRVRLGSAALLAAGLAGVTVVVGTASSAHPALAQTRLARVNKERTAKSGRDLPHRGRPVRLRSAVPGAPVASGDREAEIPQLRRGSADTSPAPPQAITFSTAGSPPLLAAFGGLNSLDARADPPDPDVAAGNGFVVESVNNAIRVFGTDGSVKASYDAGTFFQSTSGDVTDPSVVFDAGSGRWFASILDSGAGTVRLAVSQTGDPTGAWTVYVHAPGTCADQPTLGVSPTLVVIGYGGFTLPCRSSTARFEGGGHYVYDKADLLAGTTGQFTAWDPNPAFGPISAVTQSPDPAVALALTANFYLQVFTFTGVPTTTTSATETITSVVVQDLVTPPGAAQKNGTAPVDTGDVRIRSGTEDAATGTIWATADDSCVPPGDSAARACLRVIALRAGQAVYDRDIAWRGGNLFYGRIAVDSNGNAVVVHGYSSASSFPSVGVFALSADGGVTPSTPIAIGNQPHNDPRFGDYFGAAPDGSGGVWVVGEVGTFVTGSRFDWGTMVAHVGASPPLPPPPPPPPPDRTPPHARALASSGRPGKTAFLHYQASDDSGRTREVVTVYARSTAVRRISVRTSVTRAGRSYAVAWRMPAKPVLPLKFCVVAFDPAGNASAKSCARISVG